MRLAALVLLAGCAAVRGEVAHQLGPPLIRVDRADPYSKLLSSVQGMRTEGTFRSTVTCGEKGAWFKLSHATREEAGPMPKITVAVNGFHLDDSAAMDLVSLKPRLAALKATELMFLQDANAPVGNLCDVMEAAPIERTYVIGAL